ncbi:MAG TPA: DUF3179 domain-containing (seleno)protein [Phototrophicaceae bacterium]|jgi:hypothetical protein|nr:DUF3179 domain-containing (seleno)protein [Phototrophicaceae bacterium]
MNDMQEVKSFDVGRAVLQDYLDTSLYPARLVVTELQSLSDALAVGIIAPDTRLLVFEYQDILYTFPMAVVLCYNVLQGEIDNQPWMMTFCNACNTGMVFNPVVDGQTLHFQRRGSYDGLLLIWDEETDSYWQHITGECLYGASAGQHLKILATTRQMQVSEALSRNARLLTSSLSGDQEKLSHMMEKMRAYPEKVEAGIVATIQKEDTRRPRFELGLGVWAAQGSAGAHGSTFFPLVMLYACESVIMTEFDGRRLLIYQTPDAISPVAVYLNTRQAWWEGDMLRLDNGAYIQNDVYVTAAGRREILERPRQLLMRWYGFALTFPDSRLPDF